MSRGSFSPMYFFLLLMNSSMPLAYIYMLLAMAQIYSKQTLHVKISSNCLDLMISLIKIQAQLNVIC